VSIRNVGPVNALAALGSEPYSSAKAGIGALTINLAASLAADGIRVNTVAPATIRTRNCEGQEGGADRFRHLYPLRRVGEPEDVAAAVAFLASSDLPCPVADNFVEQRVGRVLGRPAARLPAPRHGRPGTQRCWWHKIGNVLPALPKSVRPAARPALAEIDSAEDNTHARAAAKAFAARYSADPGSPKGPGLTGRRRRDGEHASPLPDTCRCRGVRTP
jgi:hypothetical protein